MLIQIEGHWGTLLYTTGGPSCTALGALSITGRPSYTPFGAFFPLGHPLQEYDQQNPVAASGKNIKEVNAKPVKGETLGSQGGPGGPMGAQGGPGTFKGLIRPLRSLTKALSGPCKALQGRAL